MRPVLISYNKTVRFHTQHQSPTSRFRIRPGISISRQRIIASGQRLDLSTNIAYPSGVRSLCYLEAISDKARQKAFPGTPTRKTHSSSTKSKIRSDHSHPDASMVCCANIMVPGWLP